MRHELVQHRFRCFQRSSKLPHATQLQRNLQFFPGLASKSQFSIRRDQPVEQIFPMGRLQVHAVKCQRARLIERRDRLPGRTQISQAFARLQERVSTRKIGQHRAQDRDQIDLPVDELRTIRLALRCVSFAD